jgi:hypothetical protein
MVNRQQQRELIDLCKLLQIEVPLKYLDHQWPDVELAEERPATFVAEFTNRSLFDHLISANE